MSGVGQREIKTQQRVITFLRDALGYDCLGHWQDRRGTVTSKKTFLAGWFRLVKRAPFEIGA